MCLGHLAKGVMKADSLILDKIKNNVAGSFPSVVLELDDKHAKAGPDGAIELLYGENSAC